MTSHPANFHAQVGLELPVSWGLAPSPSGFSHIGPKCISSKIAFKPLLNTRAHTLFFCVSSCVCEKTIAAPRLLRVPILARASLNPSWAPHAFLSAPERAPAKQNKVERFLALIRKP